jgi:ATP-dependent exoDNAse (exonuclease V) alpha subunit
MLCAWSSLREDREGHTWFPLEKAHDGIKKKVGSADLQPVKAIRLGISDGWLETYRDDAEVLWISEPAKARNETLVANQLTDLVRGKVCWPKDIAGGLSEHQREQVAAALTAPVGILAGGPGTGKTYSVAEVVRRIVQEYGPSAVAVAAPTGKAAVRCTAAMQKYGLGILATTIHRLLRVTLTGGDWQFKCNAKTPLVPRFIVIDEASMLDTSLAAALLAACQLPTVFRFERPKPETVRIWIPARCRRCNRLLKDDDSMERGFGPECAKKVNPAEYAPVREGWREETGSVDAINYVVAEGTRRLAGTHVLFIGDPGQLPPVGHGAPLRDMIASEVIPTGELTEIQRNAGMSVRACHAIRAGVPFKTCDEYKPPEENLRHIEGSRAEVIIDKVMSIIARVAASGKFDPIDDTQVIVPVNKKSELSRIRLNEILQGQLNPDGRQVQGNPFRVGDKVICAKNSMMMRVSLDLSRAKQGDKLDPADASWYVNVDDDTFVVNGDMARVVAIGPKQTIAVFQEPKRLVRIPMGKPDADGDEAEGFNDEGERSETGCNFTLAYAITGHKAQGSQWPLVVCVVDKSGAAKNVCSREWHYTVLPRAEKLTIIVGPRETIDQHCRRVVLRGRKTFLTELLKRG